MGSSSAVLLRNNDKKKRLCAFGIDTVLPNTFDLRLVESIDVTPKDAEIDWIGDFPHQ